LEGKVTAPVYKSENTAVGIRHADHMAPSIRKTLALSSQTSGGRSVGRVRLRTQATEFSFSLIASLFTTEPLNYAYRLLVGKPEGKGLLGRPRHK
jgi:hypothetical protein